MAATKKHSAEQRVRAAAKVDPLDRWYALAKRLVGGRVESRCGFQQGHRREGDPPVEEGGQHHGERSPRATRGRSADKPGVRVLLPAAMTKDDPKLNRVLSDLSRKASRNARRLMYHYEAAAAGYVHVMLDTPARRVAPGWCALVILQGDLTVRGEVPLDASREDIEQFARDKCPRPDKVEYVVLATEVEERFGS